MRDVDRSGGVTEPWSGAPSLLGDGVSHRALRGGARRHGIVAIVAAMTICSGICGSSLLVGSVAHGEAGSSVFFPAESSGAGIGFRDVSPDSDLDGDASRDEARERRRSATRGSEHATGASGESGGEKEKSKDKSVASTKSSKNKSVASTKSSKNKSTASTKGKSSKKDDSISSSYDGEEVERKSSGPSGDGSSESAPVEGAVESDFGDQHEFWFEALDYDDQAALDAGYMIDCDGAWYCVHWWTDYGQQILSLEVGDVVHVNGSTAVIDCFYDLARDSYIDDVRSDVGYDGILLQTCYYGGSPTMLLCHGYYI